MKQLILMTCCALLSTQQSAAKIWRVNNNPGITADFSTLSAAITAAAAGDTLHIESSGINYGSVNINKRLVIRGTGYFLDETVPNPKTQYLKEAATIASITLAGGSKKTVVEGLVLGSLYLQDSFITVQRNHIGSIYLSSARHIQGDTIRHNYLTGSINLNSSAYKNTGLFIYNNIINGSISVISSAVNNMDGYIVHNTFLGTANFVTSNCVYQNNIFNGSNFTTYRSSNTFLNNVSVDAHLPPGNGNITGATFSGLFIGGSTGAGYSSDGRYRLVAGSPAIGAGQLNGVVVDCGAFGGPAPYILSGMPQMPSIYQLDAPTNISSGITTMTVTLSAAAH